MVYVPKGILAMKQDLGLAGESVNARTGCHLTRDEGGFPTLSFVGGGEWQVEILHCWSWQMSI